MSKRRRRIPFGNLVVTEPLEVAKARETLRGLTGVKQLGLEPTIWQGGVEFALASALAAEAYADRPYKVLPLVRADIDFWVGVVLRFLIEKLETRLTHASLLVFRGTAGTEMAPMLRAEWDCPGGTASGPHAQPHWHVYGSALAAGGQPDRGPRVDPFPPEPAVEPALDRFHFAMASSWHSGSEDGHLLQPEPASFGLWLEGCGHYVREQLVYLARRRPG